MHQDTRFVDILPEDTSTDIPFLTFSGGPSSTETVRFFIGAEKSTGGPSFRNDDFNPSPMGRHFKGMDAWNNMSATTYLYGGITGAFGTDDESAPDYYDWNIGDGARILVDRLVRFDADGAIRGDFSVDRPGGANPDVFVIEGGDLSDKCDISANHGPIVRVRAVGDMKAKIDLLDGDIDMIDAGGRITGYGPEPIFVKKGKIGTIRAVTEISQFEGSGYGVAMIRANEGIDAIICTGGFIEAYIVANDTEYDATVTDGSIRKIECHSLYELDVVNNVKTTIVASKFKKEGSDSGVFVSTSGTGAQYALLKATGNAESEIIFGGDVLANGTSPIIEIGGGSIPLFFMPKLMQQISSVSPFKWATIAIENGLWRAEGWDAMFLPGGVLLAIGLVGFWVGRSSMLRSSHS